jgi:hypothetical protein
MTSSPLPPNSDERWQEGPGPAACMNDRWIPKQAMECRWIDRSTDSSVSRGPVRAPQRSLSPSPPKFRREDRSGFDQQQQGQATACLPVITDIIVWPCGPAPFWMTIVLVPFGAASSARDPSVHLPSDTEEEALRAFSLPGARVLPATCWWLLLPLLLLFRSKSKSKSKSKSSA